MFLSRIVEALADLSDDLIDARELRGAQLQRDARLAYSLFLSQCGQLFLEEGRRIRSFLTRFPLREPTSDYANHSRKCGARGPLSSCIFPEGHPFEHWDGTGTWPIGICPAAHNSSDQGWHNCQREYGHPGKHSARNGFEWVAAPAEQEGSVISAVYDD